MINNQLNVSQDISSLQYELYQSGLNQTLI